MDHPQVVSLAEWTVSHKATAEPPSPAPPATPESDTFDVAVFVGNEVLCRGLEAVLRSLSTVDSVRSCASEEEATILLHAGGYDFVVVTTAEAEWLTRAMAESEGQRKARVLMLVDEASSHEPGECASVPVDGFLSRQDLDADTLRDALDRCRRGQVPMPSFLARALLAHVDVPAQRWRSRAVNLTSREVEALTLLVHGLSNKEIARKLAISSHGAKRLVASIMLKLDSPNRTTAAVNAIKAGIVDVG